MPSLAFFTLSFIDVLKYFTILTRKTPVLESLVHKDQVYKRLQQVFSFEYCGIFKSNLFYRPHPVAAKLNQKQFTKQFFGAIEALAVYLFLYRREYNLFKPRNIFRQNRCYDAQGKFQIRHRTHLSLKIIRTFRICVALKAIWNYCNLTIFKLIQ